MKRRSDNAVEVGFLVVFSTALVFAVWLSLEASPAERDASPMVLEQVPTAKDANEVEWCKRLAGKYEAEVEVRLWDDSRVDLLTAEEAIEVDWAKKWPEAVGQAQ